MVCLGLEPGRQNGRGTLSYGDVDSVPSVER